MNQRLWQCTERGYIFSQKNLETHGAGTLKSEMDMLYVEGKAEKEGETYTISHDEASRFDAEERQLLTLPRVFPYRMEIQKRGMPQDPDFHFVRYFLKPNGELFVNPKVIGSYVEISADACFMMNHDQYRILQLVEESRKEEDEDDRQTILAGNLRRVAAVQKDAACVQAQLDAYLKTTEVTAASKLSITLSKNEDGTYCVEPVLLNEDGTKLPAEINQDFQKRFQSRNRVESLYRKSNGYFVFDDAQVAGLKEVKDKRKLEKEEAKNLLINPRSIFDSDVFQFDLRYYSDRVESYGTFIKENLPYIASNAGQWIPEEGTESYGHNQESAPDITAENARELADLIAEAAENEKTTFTYQGKSYPLTPQLVRKVSQACKEDTSETKQAEEKVPGENKDDTDRANGPRSLIIKDNVNALDYTKIQRQNGWAGSLETADIFGGLRPEISLFDHQKEGIRWMFDNWKQGYKGVLLADDMGLGKTMQALAFAAGLKKGYGKAGMKSVLIVAPVSLLENWKEEISKFILPGLFEGVVDIYGSSVTKYKSKQKEQILLNFQSIERNKIVLTTYETLRTYDLSFGLIDWSLMIIDEAQKIKNPNSLIARAIKAMKYDFGLALTGTPVENTWIDLWSIMDFVIPGKLGSLKEFGQKYQNRLKDIRGNAAALETLGAELEQALKPVFLRRQKSDHLKGLPQKTVRKIEKVMPPAQQAAYEAVIHAARGEQGKGKRGEIFRIIAALRDVSLCPNLAAYKEEVLLAMGAQAFFASSARLQAVYEILKEVQVQKEKVLIFIESRKLQRVLKYFLEKEFGINIPTPINGTVDSAVRQDIVRDFNKEEGFAVLLLSPEAGGVGFNITGANHVIHLSRCWNPAKEDQATDRVYRIGQKKDVYVYLPIAVDPMYGEGGSFDEKLDELLTFKRRLSESVIFPTGDSEKDGIAVFNELMDDCEDKEQTSANESAVWTIEELNKITPDAFRRVVMQLYDQLPAWETELLDSVNSNGIDFLVRGKERACGGLAVRCVSAADESLKNTETIQELAQAAQCFARKLHGTVRGVIVSNANGFSSKIHEAAKDSGVLLIGQKELQSMLKQYPVQKFSLH